MASLRHSSLPVISLTSEIRGSNLITGRLYIRHKETTAVHSLAHPYRSALVNSIFYPPWDCKLCISLPSQSTLHLLQRVQNIAVRLVFELGIMIT